MMARQAALTVAHVADRCRRYPGEPVMLYTQVVVTRAVSGYRLDIGLTPGLELAGHRAPEEAGGTGPQSAPLPEPEQGVLLAPADAPAQLLQVLEVQIDEIAQCLAAGDRLGGRLLAAADPAFLLGRPSLGPRP